MVVVVVVVVELVELVVVVVVCCALGGHRDAAAHRVSQSRVAVSRCLVSRLACSGRLFVAPGHQTYTGHIIGECSRDSPYDMDVNPVKGKKLSNVRAAGNDEAVRLPPPRLFSLEDAIVYVAADELVEVTPAVIRLRKRILDITERDKFSRTFAKSLRDEE
jgi:predicted membrane GTPase involved in stress response